MKKTIRRGIEALLSLRSHKGWKAFEAAGLERSSSYRRMRAFCFGQEEGNALIEFTLTLPILMAVLTAIFQLGIAFNNQLQLTQGVGAAAQYLQTIRSTTTDPCKDVMTVITNSSPTLRASGIGLTLTMNGNSPVTGSSCSGYQTQLAQQEPATVYATYPCSISIYGFNFSPTCKLMAQVTEYEY
jgi:Flp pilus assembly protein TadG